MISWGREPRDIGRLRIKGAIRAANGRDRWRLVVKGRKNKSAERPGSSGMVSGVAWYRVEQWPRLLEVSVDRSELERTYDEWQAMATKGLAELARAGVWARKVDVDVDELVEWCRTNGRLTARRVRRLWR